MPAKRRISKRRLDPRAELAAWYEIFDIGMAATGDWDDIGMASEAEMLEAAPAAWARLGRAFLDAGMSTTNSGVPWALKKFGEPPCQ